MIEDGNALVAVGAGQPGGPDGPVAPLRATGYSVSRAMAGPALVEE